MVKPGQLDNSGRDFEGNYIHPSTYLYSPMIDILGTSYRDWIIKWWNQEQDPRPDGVFLLFADFDGTMSDVIDIPATKQGLLVSPINFIAIHDKPNRTEQDVRNVVKHEIDIINQGLIKTTFDGIEFGPYCSRIVTDFFTLKNGKKAIADGYWLFFRGPFHKGEHSLNSFGTCRSGQIKLSGSTILRVT